MHFMARRINLMVLLVFNQPLVVKFEGLLQTTCTCYYYSLKKHFEHGNLAKLHELRI
jgi:hypothetical protein